LHDIGKSPLTSKEEGSHSLLSFISFTCLFEITNINKGSSPKRVRSTPKPFDTARQRLKEQLLKEPVKTMDAFLRTMLLAPQ